MGARIQQKESAIQKNQASSENNISFLRLALAVAVIFQHSFDLAYGDMLHEPLRVFTSGQTGLGDLAVNLFFFLSGTLITSSWLNSKSTDLFIRKRIARIFPGFLVCMLISAIVACAFSTPFRDVFLSKPSVRSFFNDLVFLGDKSINSTCAFPQNPWPHVSNGSLWTIQREFKCYLLVAIAGILGILRWRLIILFSFALVYCSYVRAFLGDVDTFGLDRRFLTYFLGGISVWLWRDLIPVRGGLACLCAMTLLTSSLWFPKILFAATPIATGYLLLWAAFSKKIRMFSWCDRVDLSYGLYLYGFLIQQVIASYHFGRTPITNFLVSIPLSVLFAVGSWFLIEKPFVRSNWAKSQRPNT